MIAGYGAKTFHFKICTLNPFNWVCCWKLKNLMSSSHPKKILLLFQQLQNQDNFAILQVSQGSLCFKDESICHLWHAYVVNGFVLFKALDNRILARCKWRQLKQQIYKPDFKLLSYKTDIKVGFIYTFWYSLSSISSILE